jgi:hypothetical protein
MAEWRATVDNNTVRSRRLLCTTAFNVITSLTHTSFDIQERESHHQAMLTVTWYRVAA